MLKAAGYCKICVHFYQTRRRNMPLRQQSWYYLSCLSPYECLTTAWNVIICAVQKEWKYFYRRQRKSLHRRRKYKCWLFNSVTCDHTSTAGSHLLLLATPTNSLPLPARRLQPSTCPVVFRNSRFFKKKTTGNFTIFHSIDAHGQVTEKLQLSLCLIERCDINTCGRTSTPSSDKSPD